MTPGQAPPGEEPREYLILHLRWTQDRKHRSALFGPWPVTADCACLGAVALFMRRWLYVTQAVPSYARLAFVTSPDGWLRDREDSPFGVTGRDTPPWHL
jgi:hypothetical protein